MGRTPFPVVSTVAVTAAVVAAAAVLHLAGPRAPAARALTRGIGRPHAATRRLPASGALCISQARTGWATGRPGLERRREGGRLTASASQEAMETKEETRRRLKEMGYDPKLLEAAAGSRWDPTFQRWVKDDRTEYADIIITPKAGSPYIIWPAIFQVLVQKGLKSIPTKEVQTLIDGNRATVVDVRMKDQFEKGHVSGAINVPMFRDSTGTSVWDNLKRVVNAALLTRSTERDPDFPAKVEQAVKGKGKPIVLYCGMGGSLETKIQSNKEMYKKDGFDDVDKSFGRESRSLKACFELLNAGFTNVKHMKGGFSTWKYEKRPTE